MPQQDCKTILLVEDDTVDAMAVKKALEYLHINDKLAHVINGEEALEYLNNEANDKPHIILLDLNMPKMSGVEFMKVAKADSSLKKIPVVVLTTSRDNQDRKKTFELGVAGYIVKPLNLKKFMEIMEKIQQYWDLTLFPDDN